MSNAGTAGSTITTTGAGDFTVASGDDVAINGAGADAAITIGTTAVAHTITVGNSTGATAIALNAGTGALDIGTNAIAHVVTIGNITGATAVNVNAGTAGSTITTTGAGDFTVASGDDVAINGAGADAAITIGTTAVAHTITVGNVTGATAVNVNSGTGGYTNTTTGAGDFTVASGDDVAINGAGADAAITIGTTAVAHTITVGNVTGATAVNVNAGTAGSTITTTGAGDFTVASGDDVAINGAGADAAITIGTTAVAHTITVVTNRCDSNRPQRWCTGALDIGTNAIAHVVTIGNITGATAVNVNAGTAGSTITTTGAGDFTVASGDDVAINGAGADAAITIGTTAVAHTITVGNSTGATAIALNAGTGALDIGTNAIAHVVTIGNITGATAVNVNAGTAGSTITTTGAGDFTVASGDDVAINGAGADAAITIGTTAVAHTITVGNVTGATAVNEFWNRRLHKHHHRRWRLHRRFRR